MQIRHVWLLGVKELRGLMRDNALLVLIVFSFTVSIYISASAFSMSLNKATIGIVDQDRSQLSTRIAQSFYPPFFIPPNLIDSSEMDARMDAGLDTFALVIPPSFERDLLAGRTPDLQLNVDATRMTQAFTGSGYIEQIVSAEIAEYLSRYRDGSGTSPALVLRSRFNQSLDPSWFGTVNQVINSITMLSIILTGAALIREKEHGTVEHLLVMPVSAFEIMLSKVWSMGAVVLASALFALVVVVQWMLGVPLQGSLLVFTLGAALMLFATTSLGIFLATMAGSMPQFGLLLMLVLLPLQMLSGGMTPRENMPELIQWVMLAAPTTHFVIFAQAILFRGAGLGVVWPQLMALLAIGGALFWLAMGQFRKFLR